MYRSFAHRALAGLNHIYLRTQHKLRTCLPGGYPIGAMVELSSVCNLKCALCPSGNLELKRKTGFMDFALFKSIVDQLDDTYVRDFIPAMWGESIIHPQFLEFMRYARTKTWRISLSTNGNKTGDDQYFRELIDTGLDEIVCAVDGHDQTSYEAYRRGGKLTVVHEFLRRTREARDKAGRASPRLVAQTCLFKSNEEHVTEIEKEVRPYVDEFRTKKSRTFYTDNSKVREIDGQIADLRPSKTENLFSYAGRPICSIMLYALNVNWDGEVIACCKDPTNVLRFGSLRESSLKDIMQSDSYRTARQRLLKGDYWEDVCRRCCTY